MAFLGVSLGEARQGRVNNLGLASLTNFSGLSAKGLNPSCLISLRSLVQLTRPSQVFFFFFVLGPEMIKAQEYCFWARQRRYGLALDYLWQAPGWALC